MNNKQIIQAIDHLEAQTKYERANPQRAESWWIFILGFWSGLILAIILIKLVAK